MKRLTINSNKIKKNEEAVVGVVVAVLLVGLLLAIFLIFQTVFVPNWMEQLEAEHLEDVGNQFALLKFAVDTQSATEKDIPITTSITLGNKELPFFSSSRAFGFLRITEEECIINFTKNATTWYTYNPGIIKYTSSNSYYLDQSYIYEAGAIISSQAEGNVVFIRPSFFVNHDTVYDQVNISFTLTNIKASGDKKSVSGFGTYPIQTNYSSTTITNITGVQKINIITHYPNAWHTYINSSFIKQGLEYGTSKNYWITKTDNDVTINFNSPPVNPVVNVYLEAVDIFAQIAPGWIE